MFHAAAGAYMTEESGCKSLQNTFQFCQPLQVSIATCSPFPFSIKSPSPFSIQGQPSSVRKHRFTASIWIMPRQALGVIWHNPLSDCLRPAQHSLTFRITQHVVNFDLLTLSNTGEPCSKPPGVASPNWANQHGPLTFSHMVSVSKVPSRSLEGAAEI